MRAALRPLTPEERAVAQQNYGIIESFLRAQRLSFDEWFDVVVFRYLLTVEIWFQRPELYQYEFSTIAWNNMRSAVCNERKKQSRRIKTISLDEIIPGTDGLTWNDLVTEDNLHYTPYKEAN